ncbi:MAG: DUF1592 domain-containing protein [Verrucomicrobiota bacterium]
MSGMLFSLAANEPERWEMILANSCLDCHDRDVQKGGVDLEFLLDGEFPETIGGLEQVLRQIEARQMPPVGEDRPSPEEYETAVSELTALLDSAAKEFPDPGRTDSIRRLTRFEYGNAIRDLLDLEIDVDELLPADESSHGFENITVGGLSAGLLERYLVAAQKVSTMAVGAEIPGLDSRTLRIPPDLTQEEHVMGLPLGTRGGGKFRLHFPATGEYEVRIFLSRDRNEMIEGLNGKHRLLFLLDGEEKSSLEIVPPKNRKDHTRFDQNLVRRFRIEAGPRDLGITFLETSSSLEETFREPYDAHFNFHRHPRLSPAIFQVSITGPFDPEVTGETPSRRKIFSDAMERIETIEDPIGEAREIVARLARKAFRRPVGDDEVARIVAFAESKIEEGGGFEKAIEASVAAILVSRPFLFRVESDPAASRESVGTSSPEGIRALSDAELASRLSFFLWSSLPDETLLSAVEEEQLHDPERLAYEARRMLSDPKAESLVTSFADQWLYLRNLDSITPDGRLFPGFDENLREAFRMETSLVFQQVVEKDLSVLTLLDSDTTFLNERLAKHYGIPHVQGTRFREVALSPESRRGGLLRHGSILTVTSYANRTSPVLRGHWILENLLGTPPPPPPPNVPALEDTRIDETLPIRDRLAAHREKKSCASCHNVIDPIGFAMENFDAVGRWRSHLDGVEVDARGGIAGGEEFDGISGLEKAILAQPERFVRTLTEKLLTYALGRGVEPRDHAAVREIVRKAEENDYRFSAIIEGIVLSDPFRKRRVGGNAGSESSSKH